MDIKTKNASSGLGCIEVIGIVLLLLKIIGVEPVARWPWSLVLCPFWIPVVLIFGLALLAGLFGHTKK